MAMIAKVLNSLRFPVSCVATVVLAACGGGGSSGNSDSMVAYAVNTTVGPDGSISPSSATVNGGGTTRFTVTPNSGYAISSVTGCGGTLSGNTYTTGAIDVNCTVSASFVAQYTVTASAGAGGTVTPPSVTVNSGNTATFTVAPNRNGYAATVAGCDGTLSGSIYTTGTVTGDCAVTVSFGPAFTWVSGSNTVGSYGSGYGVYGTEGVPAATNVPGVREYAVGWIDHGGNLWLFGGYGWSWNGTGHLNDLWKYSPLNAEWTWVSGSNAAYISGVYGTQGVAAPTNAPGGRYNAISWTDTSGDLWLFGGFGLDSSGNYGDMNDLWEFSPSSGEWTWVSGSDTVSANGVYGTEGVASSSNVPGARENAVSWTDGSGDLWLFGGWGQSIENDLWEYSPSSGKWTWMGGSSSGCNVSPCVDASGIYGVRGVAAASNVPGARYDAVSWADGSGNLWLLGGLGYDSNGTYDRLNDLWEYSIASGEWTWVGGSSTVDASGVYGTEGVAADQNVPGARSQATGWVDASGGLWLFGGFGFDSTGNETDLNDLWKFSPSSGEWTWVGGHNTGTSPRGIYGIEGVAAASNLPGGRYAAVSWIDSSGDVWLFGGQGVDSMNNPGYLNDLWEYPTQ